MAVHVVWNTLHDPLKKSHYETAVLKALAGRPRHEHWDIRLTETPALPGWTAVISGPNQAKIAWYFHRPGLTESAEEVQGRIAALLRAAGL
jgi:hypothetical protein